MNRVAQYNSVFPKGPARILTKRYYLDSDVISQWGLLASILTLAMISSDSRQVCELLQTRKVAFWTCHLTNHQGELTVSRIVPLIFWQGADEQVSSNRMYDSEYVRAPVCVVLFGPGPWSDNPFWARHTPLLRHLTVEKIPKNYFSFEHLPVATGHQSFQLTPSVTQTR